MKKRLKCLLRRWIYFTSGKGRLLSLLFENRVIRSQVRTIQEDDGYLQLTGWLRSWQKQEPVDMEGNELPRLTYPFIDFFIERLKPSFFLFEFGCGSYMRYYAQHVASVDAVEHDPNCVPEFTEEEKEKIRVYIVSLEQQEKYTNILHYLGKKYQIIIVDGRHRVCCMRSALNYLTDDGVLILNDSERERYSDGKLLMRENGFRQLDFYGMKALGFGRNCTSIFYRQQNCMQI